MKKSYVNPDPRDLRTIGIFSLHWVNAGAGIQRNPQSNRH